MRSKFPLNALNHSRQKPCPWVMPRYSPFASARSIVFVKYMDRDWKKMSKWIDEHMCVMTRCRIRRMLEEKGFLKEKGLLQKGVK